MVDVSAVDGLTQAKYTRQAKLTPISIAGGESWRPQAAFHVNALARACLFTDNDRLTLGDVN